MTGKITQVAYRNAARPWLGVEVLRLSELYRRVSSEHLDRPQRVDFHLLLLFVAGAGTHTVDFTEYDCRPGTLIQVRPGQVQQFGRQPGLEAHLVVFTPAFLLPVGPPLRTAAEGWLRADASPTPYLRLQEPDYGLVRASFRALETEQGRYDPSTVTTEIMRYLLHVLVLRLVRLAEAVAPAQPSVGALRETYQRYRAAIEASYVRTRQVQEYARKLGYSRRTLNRACLAMTGTNAKQVVDARVLLEAKRLLAYTDLPVATIANRLGFSEVTNFTKFFRRLAGDGPTAFRSGVDGQSLHESRV